MENLKRTFCKYDMVCNAPKGTGVEIVHMPEFFTTKKGIEADAAHVHAFYEIVWFQEGAGEHYVDFNKYPVTPNSIFFIAPGQVHTFDERHDQRGFVMKICGDLLNDAAGQEASLLKYNIFNTIDNQPYKTINATDAPLLEQLVLGMESELNESDSIGHLEYMQSLIKMFIIQVERSCKASDNSVLNLSVTSHKVFLSFRQLLEKHYREHHTVKAYASLLGVSTKTLSNYVTECSTYSPLEMINNRIILEAKRMLRYSNMMIKEIAYELGFDDPSYFIKFFKRQAKCSPAEYRNPE